MNAEPDGTMATRSDGDAAVAAALARFAQSLKRHRQAAGLTQLEAARATGTTQGYWSKLEAAAQDPSLALVLKIIRLFELDSIEAFFGPAATGRLMATREPPEAS
jgi:transcriptional regulator with XRE-family HTH domain